MVKTPSTMMALGKKAPDFALTDTVSGDIIKLNDGQSYKGTAILFICNHCPFVIHIQEALARVAKNYGEKGIRFIAISSNDVETHPDDSPENMKRIAAENGYTFPYLYDETQEVAKAYGAACTPDLFLFDENLACVYRGQFDASTPGNDVPVTGDQLCNAMDNLLAGTAISDEQQPSVGCNIKWR